MRKIRSYVLRKKRLTPLQQRSLETYRNIFCIPFGEGEKVKEFLSASRSAVLEIGFGMGEVTAEIAEANPGTNYLGIEVFEPGIGKLLHEISARGLKNLQIISHDAVEVVQQMIPYSVLDGIHLFFPDPWPKKRHHKRRLIQQEFVSSLLPLLKAGGYIYVVTDWEDYARHILQVFGEIQELHNPYSGYAPLVSWRPRSKFEQKGLGKDHLIREIWVEKLEQK